MTPKCDLCQIKPVARGLCARCYERALKRKEFEPYRRGSAEAVFKRSYQVVSSGCWEWTAAFMKTGYGALRDDNGKLIRAHRFAYRLLKGPITHDRLVLHSCDNRKCVNPEHLRLGTHKENSQDASKRGRLRMGSKSHFSKLTEEQIIEIRRLALTMKQKDIASLFQMSRAVICQIISRQVWKHIP